MKEKRSSSLDLYPPFSSSGELGEKRSLPPTLLGPPAGEFSISTTQCYELTTSSTFIVFVSLQQSVSETQAWWLRDQFGGPNSSTDGETWVWQEALVMTTLSPAARYLMEFVTRQPAHEPKEVESMNSEGRSAWKPLTENPPSSQPVCLEVQGPPASVTWECPLVPIPPGPRRLFSVLGSCRMASLKPSANNFGNLRMGRPSEAEAARLPPAFLFSFSDCHPLPSALEASKGKEAAGAIREDSLRSIHTASVVASRLWPSCQVGQPVQDLRRLQQVRLRHPLSGMLLALKEFQLKETHFPGGEQPVVGHQNYI
uniref:Uncharacterized protein n=1 Tax=Sphaerodactylus townsendi TaxID=933632 RepID=A0ACB8EMU8_9SAUR